MISDEGESVLLLRAHTADISNLYIMYILSASPLL
jgi:hypothetical protein